MDARQIQRHFVAVMAKHLPPSASALQLLDLDGRSGRLLAELRADLRIRHCPAAKLSDATLQPGSIDAVVAYDVDIDDGALRKALRVLRPGGRLIALQSRGAVHASQPRQLRDNGYVRILVEPALDGLGVLLRGERAHLSADTAERILTVSGADADMLDLAAFRGHYLHLLIQQQPNLPAWKRQPDDPISWRAAAIAREGMPTLLVFSSLPKAVAFMQPAALAGTIKDINKVGKFSRVTAETWRWGAILNPTPDLLAADALAWVEIDPATAEAPDE